MKRSDTISPTLTELQRWFGKAVSRPLSTRDDGNPLAVSAPRSRKRADAWIRSRHRLTGFDRLGIYNRQYWYRLISIMQEEYPCAVHSLGLRRFNDWVIRYLDSHPPASPFLSQLDAAFYGFMARRNLGRSRKAVLQGIVYDGALSRAFDAAEGKPLSAVNTVEELGALPLRTPPHLTALELSYDFAAFRSACRADETLEARIVLKRRGSHRVVYRRGGTIGQKEISPAAFAVLEELRSPRRLADAFKRVEKRLAARELRELETKLSVWFREWVSLGWLCWG